MSTGPGTPFAIPGPGPFPVHIRIEAPGDEFVASFIGTAQGKRAMTIKRTPRGDVLVDAQGRTQGVLVPGTGEPR